MMPHLPRSAAVRLPDALRAMRGLAASVSASAVFWALVLAALRTF